MPGLVTSRTASSLSSRSADHVRWAIAANSSSGDERHERLKCRIVPTNPAPSAHERTSEEVTPGGEARRASILALISSMIWPMGSSATGRLGRGDHVAPTGAEHPGDLGEQAGRVGNRVDDPHGHGVGDG